MKKLSLKIQYTLIFISIMAFLMLLIYISGRFFLEDYYTRTKTDSLEYAYKAVDRLIADAGEKDQNIFRMVNEEYGKNITDSPAVAVFRDLNDRMNINIVLVGNNDTSVIATGREGSWMVSKLKMYSRYKDYILNNRLPEPAGPDRRGGNTETASGNRTRDRRGALKIIKNNGNYYIQRIRDLRTGTDYLEAWGSFSDASTGFLMSMPLESIRESAAVTRNFIMYICLAVMFIGSIIIYLVTGMLTRPVNRLADLSKRMSDLDFTARYEDRVSSEIDILGNSMNAMSDRLEHTIAELKSANIMLKKDIDEKIRIDELRKDFLSNVSHELKTPLSLISGYAEGLRDGMAEDAENRDYYCSVILDETVKMTSMVRQLTSLINYEFGSEKIDLCRFDLCALIRSVTDVHRISLKEKNIDILLNLPDNAYIWADEYSAEKVFTNFLTNAIHYTAEGKRIIVTVSHYEGNMYSMTVFNEGSGIPEEHIEKIWDKFYKADKARSRQYGGSGIGLSIVKAVMNAHGCPYGVRNTGDGVEFYACFEAADSSIDLKNPL